MSRDNCETDPRTPVHLPVTVHVEIKGGAVQNIYVTDAGGMDVPHVENIDDQDEPTRTREDGDGDEDEGQ